MIVQTSPITLLSPFSSLDDYKLEGGGKAYHLAKMAQAGLSVPPFFVIPDHAFRNYLDFHQLRPQLIATGSYDDFERSIEALFLAHDLPQDLLALLASKIQLTNQYAIRSSGMDEDSRDHSFAGLFSSFLNQQGMDQISIAIRRCFASAFSARALQYRLRFSIPSSRIRMGVVIQLMVDANKAGVMFTRNPIKPLDRDHAMIDSVWGLGDALVNGSVDADHFLVRRDLAQNNFIKTTVPATDVESVSLRQGELRELMAMGIRLENLNQGIAQDAEWAFDKKGELFLLQSRPVTSLPNEGFFDAQVNGQAATVWDNSNIVESFSGVTSPFTFSFASNAYEQVYRQFAEMMQVPEAIIDENSYRFRNMLGLIRGRIYYNLVHWYRLLMILPGAANNAQFMETMMGVKKSLAQEHQSVFDFLQNPPRYSAWLKIRLGLTSLVRFARARTIFSDFKANFNAAYIEARQTDYRAMSLQDLIQAYENLSNRVLKKWQAPIVNDFLCMIFFGWLKKWTASWIESGDAGASLQNDLLCGQGDLESTEPTKMLMRMAATVDQWPASDREHFLNTDAKVLWEDHAVRDQFAEFLDRYGFRCVNELKLEENDLHDDPTFVVGIVQSYVRMKAYSIEAMEVRERAMKNAAENKVKEKIYGLRRAAYFWVLKQARLAVKTREDLRFDRTKIYGVIRHLIRAVGMQLTRLGKIDAEQEVFYLTLDELISFAEGRHPTNDLRTLVQARRSVFDEYKRTPAPPERFVTYGAVGMSLDYTNVLNDGDLLTDLVPLSDDPNVMMGTACCPGVVEGIVRVAHNFKDAEHLRGEILVTSRTDPGWVPLYPSCSGLLIERGSLLSHSAVVARELGLPTIVGISGGLMTRLKTGQRVRIDASKGEVRIL